MQPVVKETLNMTQQEVAQQLGIHKATVNVIEKQAMQKIKRELERRGIDANLFFKD